MGDAHPVGGPLPVQGCSKTDTQSSSFLVQCLFPQPDSLLGMKRNEYSTQARSDEGANVLQQILAVYARAGGLVLKHPLPMLLQWCLCCTGTSHGSLLLAAANQSDSRAGNDGLLKTYFINQTKHKESICCTFVTDCVMFSHCNFCSRFLNDILKIARKSHKFLCKLWNHILQL